MSGSRVALLAVLAAGCGSSNPAGMPDAATVDAAPDAHVTSAMFTGTIGDFNTAAPIPGAKLCVTGIPAMPCATTDASGLYSISFTLPDGITRLANISTADGYLGRENLMYEDVMPASGGGVYWQTFGGLYSQADATALLVTQAGFTYPSSTTGFIQLYVSGPAAQKVPATATIAPASGAGPVYFNANVPDPAATDTSTDGRLLFGNLPPGTYEITVTEPGKTCSVMVGSAPVPLNGEWPPAAGGTLSVPVLANALTNGLAVICQ